MLGAKGEGVSDFLWETSNFIFKIVIFAMITRVCFRLRKLYVHITVNVINSDTTNHQHEPE